MSEWLKYELAASGSKIKKHTNNDFLPLIMSDREHSAECCQIGGWLKYELVTSGNKFKKRTVDNFRSLIMSFTLLVRHLIQDYASSS